MGKGFTKKTKRLLLRKILPAGIGLVACAGCAYGVNSAQYRSRFLPGTFINGINVTDQTIDEAEANLRNKEEDYALTLRFRFNEEETLDKDDLKLSLDHSGSAERHRMDHSRVQRTPGLYPENKTAL